MRATLFFADDLKTHRDFGRQGPLALPYESYKLALTKDLLDLVLVEPDRLRTAYKELNAQTNGYPSSGYYKGDRLFPNHPITPTALAEQYWAASGQVGFNTDAAQHFYLPERYTDPFGNITTLTYDAKYDLFIQSSTDMLGNTVTVERFDYRVLAPLEMVDPNGNHSEVHFDILGMVVASAVKGKLINGQWEGDNLAGYTNALANPSTNEVVSFCTASTFNDAQAHTWLGNASARFVYHFGERIDANEQTVWSQRMAGACGIVRERHASQVTLDPLHQNPLQVALECSDGSGNVLMKKVQAEPDPTSGQTRWIINGLNVLNNKGKPVKQYEPTFSPDFGCEPPQDNGVTPVMYYDAAGRLVRTELPDGTLSRVEFSPWHVKTFDQNDTVLESAWYQVRNQFDPEEPLPVNLAGAITATPEQRAGWLAAQHANTPAQSILDSLGREVIAVAHNRVEDAFGLLKFGGRKWRDEYTLTFSRLDTEGKPLWIRDALGHLVMQYITPAKTNNDTSDAMPADAVPCYDIAGNLLFQHSMDAGDRWMLMDAAGKPMLAWDANMRNLDDGTTLAEDRLFHTRYDTLHRPIEQWLSINSDQPALIEAFEYSDTNSFTTAAGVVDQVALAKAQKSNLIGQAIRHFDPSGLATVERVDFKGAVEEITRTLVANVEAAVVDWRLANRGALLEPETFVQITEYDALGRMARHYNWHRGAGSRVAVYEPHYNERGSLVSEDLVVRTTKTTSGYDGAIGTRTKAIREIRHDAKGQKTSLSLGNGTITRYSYDPNTFRLVHLYTRRDARFPSDCASDPDAPVPLRPCGVQNLHYTYDPVGNITHIQDDAQQTIWFANQQVEPSNDYSYDALYRLIEASGRENAGAVGAPPHPEGNWPTGTFPSVPPASTRNYTQRYSYDGVGNIITVEHVAANFPGQPGGSWTRHYAYAFNDPAQPASNRLWRTWEGADDRNSNNAINKVTYRYDPHGSILNLASMAPPQDIRWDWRDMIRALDLEGGGNAFYNYGSDKQRTRKHIKRNGSGSEDRTYLGGYELYRRRNAAGDVLEEIESLHLFEGEQRVLLVDDVLVASPLPGLNGLMVKQQTLFRYQYSNHLGSVGVELDEAAQVISYEEFYPYGTSAYRLMSSAAEAPAKRYRYTGMERDEESGLNYHRERYYAPWLGRWASCDPGGLTDGINLYQYSRQSPVMGIDRTGLATTPPQTNILSEPFVASGRYGWLHSMPGYTREHIIPGSWLKYALEAKYGATATRSVASRLYRNAWTSLLSNAVAGPKTSLDFSHAATLRAQLRLGGNVDVTDFYLKSMQHLQAGGPMSTESLAHAHETAVKELVSYVKGEKPVAQAAQGQPPPKDLSTALKPGSAAAPVESTATSPKAEVVKFDKNPVSPEAPALKPPTVEPVAPKPAAVETPMKRIATAEPQAAKASGLGAGFGAGVGFTVLMHILPDSARTAFEEHNLRFFNEIVNLWPKSDEDSTEAFVNKQLKSSAEPGPGIIQLMQRNGYQYDGMSDGLPKWTPHTYNRSVNLVIGQ